MPEDYAAHIPFCADWVMAGFDPGRSALPRPIATVMTTEFPRFPIGYTFGQTHTNQRAGCGASSRLRAGFAPGRLQETSLRRNGQRWKVPIRCAFRPMDFAGCMQIATEFFESGVRNNPRAAIAGLACLNKPVLRPIGESERGLRTCR